MKKPVLLVVDDKAENLFQLQELILEHLPECQAITTQHPEEGLAIAAEQNLSGAIIDVQMPELDGMEMCQRLKANKASAHIPVLMVTAHRSTTKLKMQCFAAGADDIITRPIGNLELAAKIKVMLRIKQAEDELRSANARLEQLVAEGTVSLKKSEENIRLMISEVRDYAIFALDPTGTISSWNEGAQRIKGYAAEEIIGEHFSRFFPQQDLDAGKPAEGLKMAAAEGRFEDEGWRVRKDGSSFWADVVITALRNEKGELVGFTKVTRDITERKEAEEALVKRERYFRSLLYSLHEDLVVIDRDYRITDLNNTVLSTTGHQREDVIGRHCFEISHGYSQPCSERGEECYLQEVFQTGEPRSGHHEHQHTNGAMVHVDILFSPVKDQEGKVTHVVEAVRDITKLIEIQEALRSSEADYREIFNAANDAIFIYDTETGKTLDINHKAGELLKRSREEILLLSASELSLGDAPFAQENIIQWIRRAVSEGPQLFEWMIKPAEGEALWTEVNLRATVIGGQNRVIAIVRDISERKMAEEKLKEHRERLEEMVDERTTELEQRVGEVEKLNSAMVNLLEDLRISNKHLELTTNELNAINKELGAFSYSVSHDLRAPLRAMNGFAKMLAKAHRTQLDAEGQRKLKVIQDGAQDMEQLVDDLLAFSRLGRKEMTKKDIDMNALTKEAFNKLEPGATKRLPRLQLDDLPSALGDRSMIRQVLVNLLSNAVKFSRCDEAAAIRVSGKRTDGEIVYSVKDNGVGFDMKYADKLFAVFQRLHRAQDFEGTGIGLALVQRIIHRHHGRVWAEGKVGKGATFYFALPQEKNE